jgi:hypothetical protein
MSLAQDATELPLRDSKPVARLRDAATSHRLPVFIACTVLALLVNYLLGKEVGFDTLNYHLYSGFSAVHDRFAQDYFAAGPQSYGNPYAYAPFYALVSTGLPALAIGSVLAAVHSIIFWLTFELATYVCPASDPRRQLTFGLCAVAMAFVNPILLQQIGSSFADITTAELVLAGWLALVSAMRAPHAARIICAGLILGAASALKPTNTVHAFAGFVVLLMLPLDLRGRIAHGFRYGISLGLGFAIVSAPWSYRLERMFGNPFFPFMNNVFRSPEFTTEPLRHFRFIPETFAEALWRPFAMVDPTFMVHEELRAPDLRYAVLIVLLGMLGLRWLSRRLARPSTPMPRADRVLAALGLGLAADWIAWLYGSGNSRYFLPMSCVAAIVIVGLLFRLFDTRPKVRNYVLAAVLATQALQLYMGTEFRWNAAPWDGQWFAVAMPEKLRSEPNLYLTIGIQSNSFLAPFLSRDAGLVNFSGNYPLGPRGANGARVEELIQRYAPHLRVLTLGAKLYEDGERHAPSRSEVDTAVQRFGLRTDPHDCTTITVRGLPPSDVQVTTLDSSKLLKSSTPAEQKPRDATYLVSCGLVPDDRDRSAEIANQSAADLVLDRLEDACPELFQPRRPLTEHVGAAWLRRYFNTDSNAWVSNGGVKFRQMRSHDLVYVGSESDWTQAPLKLACERRNGH